jgi:hypothetical protein
MLAQGSLNLTSVRLLAPHLSAGNHEELFAAASGKSKRELQELLARRFPQPDVAVSIRKLPAPRATPEPPRALTLTGAAVACATLTAAAVESRASAPPSPGVPVLSTLVPIPPPLSGHRPVVIPLAPDRYQITFTASAETREKLQLAQDLLRHTIPSGDTAAIIDRALTALLEDQSVLRTESAGGRRLRIAGDVSDVGPARQLGPDRVESQTLNARPRRRTPDVATKVRLASEPHPPNLLHSNDQH